MKTWDLAKELEDQYKLSSVQMLSLASNLVLLARKRSIPKTDTTSLVEVRKAREACHALVSYLRLVSEE